MMRKSGIVLLLAAMVASGAAGLPPNVTLSPDKRIVTVDEASPDYAAPPAHPPGLKTIYSNIANVYPKGLYFCCYGYTVAGANSFVHVQSWSALQFTPATDARATEIDVAVQWMDGANFIDVDLFADNNGVPGKLLRSVKAHGMQYVGGCCALVSAVFRAIKVAAGTPYWVAVTTDKNGSDTYVVWDYNSTDQINPVPWALNDNGAGWQSAGGISPGMGFAVYGK
jgi:hypothetical protein